MSTPSDDNWDSLREQIIGLGEHSSRKSYYPELQRRIRELEQTRATLADANRQLQAVLNAASEISIIATDRDGLITVFNKGAEKMLGYSADEVIGKFSPMLFHLQSEVDGRARSLSEQQGRAISGFRVFVENARLFGLDQHEWTYVRKDGTMILVNLMVTIIHNEHGSISGFLGIAEDVTGQKLMEHRIVENEKLLNTIINSIPNPIFYKDAKGVYTGCNDAFCEYLGMPRERIVGATVFDIATPELAQAYHQADLELLQRSGTQVYETTVVYADGVDHDVIFYKSCMHGKEKAMRGLVGVMLDITERKKAEAENARLTQNLLHAQKIESIGRLAGGVAHDFNNLLTPIIGYAEMLQKFCATDERAAQRLRAVLDAAGKARDLTRQLLAFGRKQKLDTKVIDLNQIIDSFRLILERTIREDVQIVLKCAPDLWSIMADATQIEQIIMNLAINAQDAMLSGGILAIETSNCTYDISHVPELTIPPGKYVRLAVSDNGSGMSQETIDHIFEPFYTTKEQGKGTGLGLATVFGIVKQHGGHVNVYSEIDHGSTFTLYFPGLAETDQFEDATLEVIELPRSVCHETILLVEDNQMVREMTGELLAERGYKVLVAETPVQACEMMTCHAGKIDLLLSDVIMPGIHGPALYDELKRRQPGLKVLFMSGYSENIVSSQNIVIGSNDYIQKPFTSQALLGKIAGILGR